MPSFTFAEGNGTMHCGIIAVFFSLWQHPHTVYIDMYKSSKKVHVGIHCFCEHNNPSVHT